MPNILHQTHLDSTLLRDCREVLQIVKTKYNNQLCRVESLQFDYEHNMYKNNAADVGKFPNRFRTAVKFLIDNRVLEPNECLVKLNNERLHEFFEKLTSNS